MLWDMNYILPTMALVLGIWSAPACADELQNAQLAIHGPQVSGPGELWGLELTEWSYEGDVIVTDVQGRFCEGFKCAHGRGVLRTEADWIYSGTFRYGDILGEGDLSGEFLRKNRTYSGLFSSTSYPGGAAPLCGEPGGEGDFPLRREFGIQFYADQVPCAGRWCALARCLKAWVKSVDRREMISQEEAQRIKRWYEPVIARQVALLGGQPRRTFDKILLAGTEFREFLIAKGWGPRSGSYVFIQRYRRPNEFQLILGNMPGSIVNPKVRTSEMLPMALWAGSKVTVINDPWTAIGLAIDINETNYVVALRKRVAEHRSERN